MKPLQYQKADSIKNSNNLKNITMKKIVIAALMLLVNFCANAQIDPVRTQLNNIFQNIDKAQIPTGYLNEYGPSGI